MKIWLSKSPTVSEGDIWDTGKVFSNATSQHVYNGPVPLESDTSYFWKVRWWDSSGAVSGWSVIARFDTALFTPNDWSNAQWLTGYNQYRTGTSFNSHETKRNEHTYSTFSHNHNIHDFNSFRLLLLQNSLLMITLLVLVLIFLESATMSCT